ncbi:MAG: hypothetical protein R3E79_12770 [Caldilineaceae bacterium]
MRSRFCHIIDDLNRRWRRRNPTAAGDARRFGARAWLPPVGAFRLRTHPARAADQLPSLFVHRLTAAQRDLLTRQADGATAPHAPP